MAQLNAPFSDPVNDPRWLPHRYDPSTDAFQFHHASRDTLSAATFLTDEYLPATADRRAIDRIETLRMKPKPASLHYIFHSAFCCSTMLARALDHRGVAVSLKEPVVLNDLIGWRRRGGPDSRVFATLDSALGLLSRPFSEGEAIVLKPSNVVAGLSSAMLNLRPDARAIVMYAPLRIYLGSIARKGLSGRLWVRELFAGLRMDGLIGMGLDPRADIQLTDLQVAAVGWLAQHELFKFLLLTLGPSRVRSLQSESFVQAPEITITKALSFFDLQIDPQVTADIARSATAKHSKFSQDFSPDERLAVRIEGERLHADEIDKVTKWASLIARNIGLDLSLENPL